MAGQGRSIVAHIGNVSLDAARWPDTIKREGDRAGPRGPARELSGYSAALSCCTGCQMLFLRVSGITNRAMMKHTAGTAIG